MNEKEKAILERIRQLEERITKGRAYLETGEHAHWVGFRPWFATKVREGKELPPHEDWVRNVFVPRAERALAAAERKLERAGRDRGPAWKRKRA